jgi:hypothetical protein
MKIINNKGDKNEKYRQSNKTIVIKKMNHIEDFLKELLNDQENI